MRTVVYEDGRGRKRARMIRDDDDVEQAAAIGIPMDPPDVDRIDWELVRADLHNLLVDRGLLSWDHVVESQNGLESVCKQVLLHRLKSLYRQEGQA